MFKRILIANRGEIAVRIIRTCRELGIATIAIASEADQHALHVRLADQVVVIGPAAASASYLRADRILAAARRTGAEAIHPGYGFLAEQADFAQACQESGLIWIGPPPAAMRLMGDKRAAKQLAEQVGVPTVPGYHGEDQAPARLYSEAQRIGLPLLIKAAAGGGGKGMRVVRDLEEFEAALAGAQREAQAAFGDTTILLERLIEHARHIEIQILADQHGNLVHLFERECSIQRRHQKIIEESPSCVLTAEQRAALGSAALRLAQAAGYVNAGTIEFLVDQTGQFFFLEMNTRLQVEHPVTESITGYDLVQLQLAIASGQPLPFTQNDLLPRGHAIEARICAEHPATFLPATGRIELFAPPQGDGIRNDVGVEAGDHVSIHYDPLVAKLIVHAQDRAAAVERLQQALAGYDILGVMTNLPLLRAIATNPAFVAGDTPTDFLELQHVAQAEPGIPALVLAGAAILDTQQSAKNTTSDPWAIGAWRLLGGGVRHWYRVAGQEYSVLLDRSANGYWAMVGTATHELMIIDQQMDALLLATGSEQVRLRFVSSAGEFQIGWNGWSYQIERSQGLHTDPHIAGHHAGAHASLEAPMPGAIVRILVQEGQIVEAQQPLIILEAMKMEHIVAAPYAGIVQRLFASLGAVVAKGTLLAEIEAQQE
jgi:3-methylcrotonyl-CoA carboxylase alpha subunit